VRKKMLSKELKEKLHQYYDEISAVILSRQHPVTGLLPASTAITQHGDYNDAWVRDNVYSILSVWGLALAYRKIDADDGRTYELEQSVVKLMRGLLFCMMRQAPKVEAFKNSHAQWDALHAKYNTATGDTVVADHAWGHLQLDATSIFVLMLAQMTTSGLRIIFTKDEVAFVQNLAFYIERAYRTPDYGIWERGNKINNGYVELNTSSVGMAKAALEAINGVDLFGCYGSCGSVVHVLGDEIGRNRITLDNLLPRESMSKEVDSALLSVISYPAFAVEDKELVERTKKEVITKLQGEYGLKRFLRDGHQTVLEDKSRIWYEPWELKKFENIESEWPLFYTYLYLDGLFTGNAEQTAEYRDRLEKVAVVVNGIKLLPELYFVPQEYVEREKKQPHSMPRHPNENVPLIWAQSLWYLGRMIDEGLLAAGEIDPLGRSLHYYNMEPRVQICLLAKDKELQEQLFKYGISTQVPEQIEPIQLRPARDLQSAYNMHLGVNTKLGLSGRPDRPMGSLSTSRVLKINNKTCVFIPQFMDQEDYYIHRDFNLLADTIKSELTFIRKHWRQPGRPTVCLLLDRHMFTDGRKALLSLVRELQEDNHVKFGRLQELLVTATTVRIDFLQEFEFPTQPIERRVQKPRHFLLPQQEPLSKHAALTASGSDVEVGPKEKMFRTRSDEVDFSASPQIPLFISSIGVKKQRIEETHEDGSIKLIEEVESLTNTGQVLHSLHQANSLEKQILLLQRLYKLEGLDYATDFAHPDGRKATVRELINEVYYKAVDAKIWSVVRRAASILGRIVFGLMGCVTEILVRGKEITIGRSVSEETVIREPLAPGMIMEKMKKFCKRDIRDIALTQELLIYIGSFMRSHPSLFDGSLRLRVGFIIDAMMHELEQERLSLSHAYDNYLYEHLMALSPIQMKKLLQRVLLYEDYVNESIHEDDNKLLESVETSPSKDLVSEVNWLRRRKRAGALYRVPYSFYPRMWSLLSYVKGLSILSDTIDSSLTLAEMTPGEKNFALRVERLLMNIIVPEERQIIIEAMMALSAIVKKKAEQGHNLYNIGVIALDKLIDTAVETAWGDRCLTSLLVSSPRGQPTEQFHCEIEPPEVTQEEKRSFYYGISPDRHAVYVIKAFVKLLEKN